MDFSGNFISWAYAFSNVLAQEAPADRPPAPNFGVMWPVLLLVFVFYIFMVIRPQKAEQKKRQEMLDQVGKGDHVVTAGGIHGTVDSIDIGKQLVSLEVAPKVYLKVNKSALASVTPKEGKAAKDAEVKADKAK